MADEETAWEPAFPEMDFGEPIIANLLKIFARDQAPALRWANEGADLVPFVRMLQCERVSEKFPSLAIFPTDDSPTLGEEDYFIDQVFSVMVEVALNSTKPNELALELFRRVKAIRMMVITAHQKDQLMEGVGGDPDNAELVLGRAVYEQVRQHETKKDQYYRSAFVPFTFKFKQG